jgi:CheY-like chemotaxis protein
MSARDTVRSYRVLLVDDEESAQVEKLQTLHDDPNVDLIVVASRDEAADAAAASYFHLALVDLQLDRDDDSNVDGQFFLRELLDGRPSCKRLLFTRTAFEHQHSIFELANPDGPLIHGALGKSDYERDWVRWVRRCAQKWFEQRIEISGLEVLMGFLDPCIEGWQAFKGQAPIITYDELDELVSRVLRVGWNDEREDSRVRATLRPPPGAQGQSRAGVVLAQCASDAQPGTQTYVLKAAPRSESKEERRRYEGFARFRVAAERRAELLGVALGDTVGVAAYAFAAGTPDSVRDLEAIIRAEDPRASEVLTNLLRDDVDDLWRPIGKRDADQPADLGAYFFDAYGLEPESLATEIVGFVRNKAKQLALEEAGGTFKEKGSGRVVPLPSPRVLGGPEVRTSYQLGLVHGDLNGRNVMLADDYQAKLIDFRHARLGAIAVDFAALECTIRLSAMPPASGSTFASLHALERRTIGAAWAKASRASPELPYWSELAVQLSIIARCRDEPLDKQEYLASCLLFSLRVWRSKTLELDSRLRLIPWLTALVSALAG